MWSLVGTILSLLTLCCSFIFALVGVQFSLITGLLGVVISWETVCYYKTTQILKEYEECLVRERNMLSKSYKDKELAEQMINQTVMDKQLAEQKLVEERFKYETNIAELNSAYNSLFELSKLNNVREELMDNTSRLSSGSSESSRSTLGKEQHQQYSDQQQKPQHNHSQQHLEQQHKKLMSEEEVQQYRLKFYTRFRRVDESFAKYLSDLIRVAESAFPNCPETTSNDVIAQTFVRNVNDNALRFHLEKLYFSGECRSYLELFNAALISYDRLQKRRLKRFLRKRKREMLRLDGSQEINMI